MYRPNWNQAANLPRIGNALWLFCFWLVQIASEPKTKYYVLGSDPQFAQLMFPFIKLLSGKRKVVYWCYDLYPEAIVADSEGILLKKIAGWIKPIMRLSYKFCDMVVDLGPCMQRRLNAYKHKAIQATLTPWALEEPDDPPQHDEYTREQLFGPGVKLGLLYSGNLGKAHDFELFLELARALRQIEPGIRFTFAGRGNRFQEFENALTEADTNIQVAGFASEAELKKRLSAADIHLMSLRADWDGIVVPSKFFGSLAVGRPVLYAGSRESDIGQWIEEYECGLILNEDNIEKMVKELLELAQDKTRLASRQENAFSAYHNHFSKEKIMDVWDELLGRNLGILQKQIEELRD